MDSLVSCGISDVAFSPGSRSSALTVSAARHPNITTHTFWDERNAGFFALGFAKATGLVCPLICTSGSAVANFFPAVCEAKTSGLPMLIISADRPEELHHTGANQTMMQSGIFGSFATSLTLSAPEKDYPLPHVKHLIVHACETTSKGKVVHLNTAWRKPLVSGSPKPSAVSTRKTLPVRTRAMPSSVAAVADVLASAERGLIVVGAGVEPAQVKAVLNWPTVECLSVIHQQKQPYTAPNAWCLEHEIMNIVPDVVLHLGGPIVGDRTREYLLKRTHAYIVVDQFERLHHAIPNATHRLTCDISDFLEQLSYHHFPDANAAWSSKWEDAANSIEQAINNAADSHCEPSLARQLSLQVPENWWLMVGNSMPIRYFNKYRCPRKRHEIFFNRGVSGIDGIVATALGIATARKSPGLLYLGDVSLLHNLNALVKISKSDTPIVVVVANNDGGAIFNRLPIVEQDDVFTSHFVTPHGTHFSPLASSLGIKSIQIENIKQRTEALTKLASSSNTMVVEVLLDPRQDRVYETQIADSLQCPR